MKCNNYIDLLEQWCVDKGKAYETVYEKDRGISYVGYLLANELLFKLKTLVDKDFDDMLKFRKTVLDLINVHYDPAVVKPKNDVAIHIINKINREFTEYLEDILISQVTHPIVVRGYERALTGENADVIIDKFREVWGYVNTCYWYPLEGDEPKEIHEKFFVMSKYFKPYVKELENLLCLKLYHTYRYGVTVFYPYHVMETDSFVEFHGVEMIYTDKDFKWAVYFSHEDTVAFAGTIVDSVKEILKNESDHFNVFEWTLD